MKKTILILMVYFTLILIVGCKDRNSSFTIKKTSDFIQPYSINTFKEDNYYKTYIQDKNGVPYLMLSSEIRLDLLMLADSLTIEQVEPYFEIAKETGLNTVEIPIMWSDVEKEKDKYDFGNINKILDYARKYDLKLNILWYGSLTDGESRTANYPKYISDNRDVYTVIKDLYDFGIYGKVKILDWSNKALLDRESKALYSVMNNIYDWNIKNNNINPVVMVQIGQGADRFQRWRINQYEINGEDGNLLNGDYAWQMINTYLDSMGKAIKYSKYRALTRVEFTEQNAVVSYVKDIKELEFIDIVSPTYLHSISNVKTGIRNFVNEFDDVPILNSENWASDDNNRNLLVTFALGGVGYVSYQLSSAVYYPEPVNGGLYNRISYEGKNIFEKFTQKGTRVEDTKAIMNGLEKAFVAVSKVPRSNFAVLGMDNRLKTAETQKIYTNSGVMFEYSNPEDSLGFVLVNDGYVYIYSTKKANILFNNVTFINASFGQFNKDGSWTNEGNVILEDKNLGLTLYPSTLYKIKIANINSLPTEIPYGYSNILDSIRG